MKKQVLFFILAVLFVASTFAQKENIIKLSPPVNDVIIYLTGAQIRYKVNVNLIQGRNLLVLSEMAPRLNPTSIKITADENSTVLSISPKVTTEAVDVEQIKLNRVNDSIKLITRKMSASVDEKNALSIQKDMLLKNLSLGGDNTGVNVAELQKAADFYQVRIFDINKQISQLVNDSSAQVWLLADLYNKAYKLSLITKTQRTEVSVLLVSEKQQSSTLEISYVVADAGWMPYYDLKCEDITQPITLNYRAKAYNNSGIDWNDIPLTLSTADPSLNIAVPAMSTWYLANYYETKNRIVNRGGKMNENYDGTYSSNVQSLNGVAYTWDFKDKSVDLAGGLLQQQSVQLKQIEVPELSFNFPIKARYTIPSNSQPYIIDVEERTIAATYQYVSIPVVEKSAFLLACISDWEELNLVEGNANIYLDGTYVGQSYLNPNAISDTLQISLGRDSHIQVDRIKLKDYSSRQLIGNKRKATYVYEINVKNNHNTPIAIEIRDQLPVSSNQDIEVTVDQISNATHDPLTGFLTWNLSIDASKVQTLKLGYTVKYPKNYTIPMKQMKVLECPSF
ncbi:MAG: DUF4139 domain-containing protein [Bacteroidota bacterium]